MNDAIWDTGASATSGAFSASNSLRCHRRILNCTNQTLYSCVILPYGCQCLLSGVDSSVRTHSAPQNITAHYAKKHNCYPVVLRHRKVKTLPIQVCRAENSGTMPRQRETLTRASFAQKI
ncbi:uncharacterized protein ZBAI_05100 [Zygosaccharomyces bailii ISA1307]|nr:uncharacterized protein ZBAI_05100 [Zygosaccharomyces bailii ISA1307]